MLVGAGGARGEAEEGRRGAGGGAIVGEWAGHGRGLHRVERLYRRRGLAVKGSVASHSFARHVPGGLRDAGAGRVAAAGCVDELQARLVVDAVGGRQRRHYDAPAALIHKRSRNRR
eukprot:3044727-Prymnesium_polylepis.2